MHRAILDGQELAFKQVFDEDEDEDADIYEARLQHEILMLHSHSLQPLMGTAIVPMMASGELRDGSAFLATKLMGCSAEDAELNAVQEQAILDALELIHQSGILHNDVHTGNVLLPRPHEQLQQPLWTDFGISEICHDRDAHAGELQLCRRLLAKHPKRGATTRVGTVAFRVNSVYRQNTSSSRPCFAC